MEIEKSGAQQDLSALLYPFPFTHYPFFEEKI
jgi:hypothetical protein